MMSNKFRDDEKLWEKVKRTVKPIQSNRADNFHDLMSDTEAKPSRNIYPHPSVKSVKPAIQSALSEPLIQLNRVRELNRLDEPTRRKISKGRLHIDAKIDLHGMTQLEAYSRLNSFLERAHDLGNRTVLIITGKGQGGEGVLKTAVPRWLNEPSFRRIVTGHHEASIPHGGSGALYVRVRRKKVE